MRAFEKPLQTAADNHDLFPILLFLTGDLEWFANSHDLPRWNANQPCGHCRVEKADLFKFKNVASPADDPWLLPRDSTCSSAAPSGKPELRHSRLYAHQAFGYRPAASRNSLVVALLAFASWLCGGERRDRATGDEGSSHCKL